jgi:hypothetical protein
MEGLRVNRGQYAQLELQWRSAIENGGKVDVEIRLTYPEQDSRRAEIIRVQHRSVGESGQISPWQRIRIVNTTREERE